ncbi:hypothetical protein [Pantoea sp. 18069]|uniref:hypothetical protein n=1 Tax=Pantoea sp. 18069 TaxID=2681415 RepID=UPI001358BB5D|nr:hypothetical protein [Pantoea sp. 18069]
MTTATEINPRLAEVLNNNIGNKITPELSVGMAATLQQLMRSVAQEAYAAGQAAELEKSQATDASIITDAEIKD